MTAYVYLWEHKELLTCKNGATVESYDNLHKRLMMLPRD